MTKKDHKCEDCVTIRVDSYDHKIGDNECENCWGSDPSDCKCGGLIHSEFGDENYDGDYWLYKQCDKCGEDYEEKE